MQLYVSPRSPFAREVLIAVCEPGQAGAIAVVPAVVCMDQPNGTVLATNPLGKIPALALDDGSAVCGRLAIIDELDRHFGGDLLPTARARRSWHMAIHVAGHGVVELSPFITSIAAPVAIDHMGRPDLDLGPDRPAPGVPCAGASSLGIDWPHVNLNRPMSDDGALVDLISHFVPSATAQARMLVENPAIFSGYPEGR